MRKFDDIKHTVRMLEGFVEIALMTLIYYYVWKMNYRDLGDNPYYGNGKFMLMGVYFLLIFVIFGLCDSFKFGHLKLMDVLTSQGIAVFIVNFFTYLQLCLIINKMITPWPLVALTLLDFVIAAILVYFYTAAYHKYYVPRDMVLIYGNDNAVSLKVKMDTRSDKYNITALISVEKGLERIKEEIDLHDAVIINDVSAQIRNDILKYCYERKIRTYLVPKITDIITRGAEEITLFDTPLLLVKGKGLTVSQRIIKRCMDILISLIALVSGSIIMLAVALAIKIEDGGPVFFKQKRVTLDGKEFYILKFRSMIVDAEKEGQAIPAVGKDPRITKVGSVIRATRIDELPQFINILKGEMSIVGPRPERVEHVEKYSKEIPEFVYRNKVKGGLTGYAQIYGKYNTSAYDKVRLDLMYIENYSLLLDIKLIFLTLQIMLKKESTEGFDMAEKLEEEKQRILESQNKKES